MSICGAEDPVMGAVCQREPHLARTPHLDTRSPDGEIRWMDDTIGIHVIAPRPSFDEDLTYPIDSEDMGYFVDQNL